MDFKSSHSFRAANEGWSSLFIELTAHITFDITFSTRDVSF